MRERLEPIAWPALALAFAASVLVEAAVRTEVGLSPRAYAWAFALGALVVVARRRPALATLGAALLIAVLPDASTPGAAKFVVPVALSYWCGAQARRRDGLAATIALIVAIQIHVGLSEAPNLEIVAGTLPPWWCGLQVQRRRRIVRELAEQTRVLEEEEEAFVRLSVERERTRIARDLHDIVSHHLALIVVQAGAGRLGTPGPDRLATIRTAAVDALAEADRLVALLHPEGGELPRLAPLLDRARELGARVVVAPPEPALPRQVEAVAHFIVREALTNAMKHAPGAPIEIEVARGEQVLALSVRNAVAAADPSIVGTGSGLGLAGMRDRAASVGGTLAVEQDDRGFRVLAELPIR